MQMQSTIHKPMNEVQTSTKRDVKSLLQSATVIAQLQRVATKYLPADRLARLLLSAVNKTPGLLNCTPESVLQAGMTCAQLGIEPDGRHAHLIPYGQQCQFICDWKGIVLLGRRNGIECIVADTIGEFDEFTYFRDELGTHFRHVPKFGGRGKTIGAYSTCKIDGQFDVEVMTSEEIESIRNRSRAGKNGPWVTDWNEMAKKTVIRRHSKRWPLLAEVAEAIVAGDDDTLEGAPRQKVEVKAPSFLDVPTKTVDDDQIPDAEVPAQPRRGRPRKESPAQAETTKEERVTSEQPGSETRVINYASGLRKLLAIEKITEGEFLNYLNQTAKVTDLPTSLEDLVLSHPDVAKAAFEEWQQYLGEFQTWVESQEEV